MYIVFPYFAAKPIFIVTTPYMLSQPPIYCYNPHRSTGIPVPVPVNTFDRNSTGI